MKYRPTARHLTRCEAPDSVSTVARSTVLSILLCYFRLEVQSPCFIDGAVETWCGLITCSHGKLEVEMEWGHFPIEYEIKPDKYVKINIYVYVSFKNDLHNYF